MKPPTHEILNEVAALRERVRALEAESRANLDFRQIVERGPDGVVVLRDGRCVYVNTPWAMLLGYEDPRSLIGRPLVEFLHPDDRQPFRARLDAGGGIDTSDLGVGPDTVGYRFKKRSDETVSLDIIQFDLLELAGERLHVLRARDVTRLRRSQARLLLADRMISVGTLAAGVAHEINNPLSYVMGNLSFIQEVMQELNIDRDSSNGAELFEAIGEAREGAERVRRIVRDLQTFSRADHQSSRPIDVRRTLELAINMAWIEIRHRARLVKDFNDVAPIEASEARLGQVFLSLLVNAAHALPEGAADKNEIRVTTKNAYGRVVIEVKDSGAGLAPEVAQRVFDPFVTSGSAGLGPGLGLSIAHSIVTDLGGEIAVETAPGQGTLFRVSLRPAFQSKAAQPATTPPNGGKIGALGRILVVDDEVLVASSLKRALRDHDVTVVSSGKQAIELLAKDGDFDLIFCDLMMPEMTGMDVYAWLRAQRPGLEERMIFISGGTFTPRAAEFLDSVSNQKIEKPFDLETLREDVHNYIHRRHGRGI